MVTNKKPNVGDLCRWKNSMKELCYGEYYISTKGKTRMINIVNVTNNGYQKFISLDVPESRLRFLSNKEILKYKELCKKLM